MTSYAVETAALCKSYGHHKVLNQVDLAVRTGTMFALLGPNGAGKTTLINILSTLIPADSGTARVAGFDVATQAEEVKKSISLTGQYAAVDEILTGRENLRMMARLAGLSAAGARARAAELLRQFDLEEAADRRVKTYSGGMRRRLDLGISLVITPPVIFLDEPTTGLDTRSRQALWEVIREITALGTTIVLTTQYLEEADQLADRIAVLNDGAVVADGTPAELKSQVGGEVVELRDAGDKIIREIATDGTISGLRQVIDGLDLDGLQGVHINIRKPSLDDVFLALTNSPGMELAS